MKTPSVPVNPTVPLVSGGVVSAPVPSRDSPRNSGTETIFARLRSAAFHEVVAASIGGDPDSLGTLFAWLHPVLVRYCRARIGRPGSAYSSADDVAQEICLAVLGALPRYDDQPESFLPFVYGIAAHKVADHYRRAGRDKSEPAAHVPDGVDREAGPEQQTLRAEVHARLTRLLDTLAPRQREILVLRLIVGLSAQQTAVATGLTPTAVRVAQHRALAKLRAGLSPHEWL
jgi:RNA polymerase sigma-70 factor, ECF subfamily